MEYFVKLYITGVLKVIILSGTVFLISTKINFVRCRGFFEKNSKTILLFFILLYTIVFSTLSILKHNNFKTNCYDLASYVQPIYQTLHGNFMYCSPEERNYLGVHTSFSLLLFAPFYHIFPDVRFILFLQSLILAIGAIPVYLIARDKLSKNLGLVFALLYLIYPPLHYINLYDFHPDILVIPSFLFAFYFLTKQRYFEMSIFLFLALLTKEVFSLTVFLFGLYLFFFHRKRKIGAVISSISLVWFFASVFYIIPYFSPSGEYQHFAGYKWLGKDFSEKFKTLIFNPAFVLKNVLTPVKIGYIILLFLPVGYLSFLSEFVLFATPILFINLLSDTIQHFSLFFQHTSGIIPFLFISAIYGLSRINFKKISLLILSLSIFFSYWFGPSPVSKTFWDKNYKIGKFRTLDFHITCYIPTSRTEILKKAVSLIPKNSSVSSQNQIAPHLVNRKKLYLFPSMPQGTEYIIIDKKGNTWPLDKERYDFFVKNILNSKKYTTVFEKDGVIVLKLK